MKNPHVTMPQYEDNVKPSKGILGKLEKGRNIFLN